MDFSLVSAMWNRIFTHTFINEYRAKDVNGKKGR